MTGFARTSDNITFENKKYSWVWEIKSVNAKGLDIKVRLPNWLEEISEDVKKICSKVFARGTFSVCLEMESENLESDIKINEDLLNLLIQKTKQIYENNQELFNKPTPAELLKLNGILSLVDNAVNEDEFENLKNALLESMEDVALILKQDRLKEGEKIAKVLFEILEKIKDTVTKVEKIALNTPEKLKEKIAQQVNELMPDINVSSERLEQEIVLLIMRADVREEIDRLYAHIKTAYELLNESVPVGRRLDFLCQELNREANTLCSKSSDIEQTKYGMELKALIEQFREQVQNME